MFGGLARRPYLCSAVRNRQKERSDTISTCGIAPQTTKTI